MTIDHSESHIPTPLTPFVGREAMLARILQLLGDPACRLLTLLGPGGIGKTRLALHAAEHAASRFPDGWFLVSCAPISSTNFVIPAIAEAVGLSIFGTSDPADQLADYLRDKRLLLVVDNFDQLVESAQLLGAICQAAPTVRLLVTSRERLGLGGERILALGGLRTLSAGPHEGGKLSDAAHLFLSAAQRVSVDHAPTEANAGEIEHLCRLVDGMPLALELAASWVRVMSVAEIADEIERNLDLLADHRRDLPDRHRSMRAAFDYSWDRLSEQEKAVFKKLSVFRGLLSREAAEAVAGATLQILSTLIDKSLVRYHPSLGFDLHELLRQYGGEKLGEDPAEKESIEQRHSAYYAEWCACLEEKLYRGEAPHALDELERAFRNVQAGWHYAVDHAAPRELAQYTFSLSYACSMWGLWHYGQDVLNSGACCIQSLPAGTERNRALARVLTHRGFFRQQLRDYEGSMQGLRESQELLRPLEIPPGPDTAFAVSLEGLTLGRAGDYDAGRSRLEQALTLYRRLGDTGRWGESECYCFLGDSALVCQDYPSAVAYFEKALALTRAAHCGTESTITVAFLTVAHLGTGKPAEALACLRAEVDWPEVAHFIAPLMLTLMAIGTTLAQLGRPVEAVEMLSAALNLPFGDWKYEPRAAMIQGLLDNLASRVPRQVFDAAWERGKKPILLPHAAYTPRRLTPEFVERVRWMLDRASTSPEVNALTERECEVLACIGRGLSNEEIAAELVISVGTVKRHIHHIFTKLDVGSRTQAIVRARELGIL